MEAILAIIVIVFIVRLVAQVGKFLWSEGIIQKAISSVVVALISGGILMAITGDPNWGVGGGIVISLISFTFVGES